MDDTINQERKSLTSSNPASYGSTKQHRIKNETFIKHDIVPGDTLQGISLKYGVSVGIQPESLPLQQMFLMIN